MKARKKTSTVETISYSPVPSVSAELSIPNPFRPLALPSMFWRPNYLKPEVSAWIGHIPFAFWVMEAQKPTTFVELGTHYGNSYFAFCQAVERLGLSTACFAVDTWKGDDHAGLYGEEVFDAVQQYNAANYPAISTLVRSTFDEALPHFEDGTIDLLHIDGHHTFEAVRHDFESWLPKLSKRAVVLFHDTNVRFGSFGVSKFFGKLKSDYPCFEFNHSHGLGVVGVGAEQPENLRHLFQTTESASATGALHQIYARLGQACVDLGEAQLVRQRVRDLEVQIGAKNQEIAECLAKTGQERENLALRIASLESERSTLESQLVALQTEKNSRVASLEGAVTERDDQIAELEGAVTERDRRIAALEESANELKSERTPLASRLSTLESQNATLVAERDTLAADKTALDSRLSSLVTERDDLATRHQSLATERDDLATRHQQLATERDALLAERSTLDSRLSSLVTERDDLATRHQSLATERDALLAEKSTLDSRLSTLVAERDDLATRHQQLATERDALLSEKSTLDSRLSTLDSERNALESRVLSLESDLQDRFEEIARLAKLHLATEDDRNAIKLKLGEMQAERDYFAADKSALASRLSTLTAEREEIASRNLILSTQRDRLTSQILTLEADLQERFKELAHMSKRLLAVEADGDRRVAEIQSRMNAMAASWTWKLGAPARWIWEALRFLAITLLRLPMALRILFKHRQSGFFDHSWYLAQNPDVKAATSRPFLHFALRGVYENRSPHAAFNEPQYLQRHPEAKSKGIPPLLHYTLHGWQPPVAAAVNDSRNPRGL